MIGFAFALALALQIALQVAASSGAPETGSECTNDDDCTLAPDQLTCCGECPPAPPYQAITRNAMDALLLEHETRCAKDARLCRPPQCKNPPPDTCEPAAGCAAGRCVIVATSCDKPVS